MNFQEIESKWQKVWEVDKIFEANPMEKKKFFLTAAFPYPNSPQHIGHARTYTTTDIYARFKRMQGYNVLFPMGFHVTGTPVLAMAKRIAAKDEEILGILKNIYKIPEDIFPTLTEPKNLVDYFSKEIELGMKEMGFSIDWRRKFYTYDATFNRFIEWQFKHLKEKGFLTQGSHPVAWCPKDNNAVGSHDTQGDVDPEIEEYVLIKFKFGNDYLLTATFRPETIYGVTNLWVNPNATYVKILSGEEYIVSKEAAEKLKMQMELFVKEEVKASELIGKSCVNPMTNEQIPILPADFVDPKNGSGVVMSVPAHAPYDYIALRDLKGTEFGKYSDKFIQVLEIEGYTNYPAKEISERMDISNQKDPKLEDATKEIYKKEAHTGKMVVGEYKGMSVIAAKEKIKENLLKEGKAFAMHDIVNGPIYCRCGAECIVKSVGNQWFINYGDENWKEQVRECFKNVIIIPKKFKGEYEYTIDWLKEKACVRASGLGTKFPYDKTQIIESLSDSTIYMAFYTLSQYLKEFDGEKLIPEFFDYVFLGEGKKEKLAEQVGIDLEFLEKMKEEFLYWYPLDSRHSAGDLIHNHLTFLLFNHVAIFPKELWPKQIVTNGFVLMDGEKMSKSLGNILPLREAIKKYGSDVVRFSVISGADLSQDGDFNQTLAEGIGSRLKFVNSLLDELMKMKDGEKDLIDYWLLSKLYRRVKESKELYEKLELREIAQEVFYNLLNELKWYLKRCNGNKSVVREFFENWVLLIAPFMPHFAEEIWEKLGKKEFVKDVELVSTAEWPVVKEDMINEKAEAMEAVVMRTKEDIDNIVKITGKKPSKIYLHVANDWKRKLYSLVYKEKKYDVVMKKAMMDEEVIVTALDAQKFVEKLTKNVNELSPLVLSSKEEKMALLSAKEFLWRELNAEAFIEDEVRATDLHRKKAQQSMPMKPSIYLE